jgi:hypothetical protein
MYIITRQIVSSPHEIFGLIAERILTQQQQRAQTSWCFELTLDEELTFLG